METRQPRAVSCRVIFEEKQYLKIIVSNLINRFGDSMDAVAFGWLVYALTGSGEWLAVILEQLGQTMQAVGVKPEIESFDPGMTYNAAYSLKRPIENAAALISVYPRLDTSPLYRIHYILYQYVYLNE